MKTSASLREYYDDWDSYDQELLGDGYYVPVRTAQLTFPFLKHGQRILDVGCGTGLVGYYLRRLGWTGELIGVDLAKRRLAEAKKKNVYTELIPANAYKLPFPDASFDAVISSGVLGLAGPMALEQMILKTKPGGVIAATVGDIMNIGIAHRRFVRVVSRIKGQKKCFLGVTHDLGTGYTSDKNNERYYLYIMRKNA